MHSRQASTRALLATVALSVLGCRMQADSPPATAESKPSAPAATAPAAPPPAVSEQAPRNVDLPAQPERVDHVTIDPRPRCGPAADEAQDAAQAWLKAPEIQHGVFEVSKAVQGLESSAIGTTFDHERHAMIVVFQQDFHNWARIRQRLVGRIAPLEVVLQPSCYPRAKLAEAERVITEQAWHPKAKRTLVGLMLDASFSGYRVVIDDSLPEVAEALRQRLGELVRVSLGKPRRI